MFRNYLVTALRNVTRHRLYSFINIAGLAVGLACAIFIILFIRDELSYDKWIPDSDNVYRVEGWFYFPGRGVEPGGNIPFPVTPAMLAQIPEVRAQTHLIPEVMTINVGNRQFSEFADVVDPGFFNVIKLPLVQGDPAAVFSQPESVVLSREMATKFFGDADPLGKAILVDGKRLLRVTGLLRDLPHNTQLHADVVLPNTSLADKLPRAEKEAWFNVDGEGFVKLAPNASPESVLAKLRVILDKSSDPFKDEGLRVPASVALQVHLTRFQDVHLAPDTGGGMTAAGSWTTIYGFAVIAALILMTACFNFMNLATARAMIRAREVSLRKVVGARRRQLMVQFLGESALLALFALLPAFAAVEILLPAFDNFLGRPIALDYATDWPLILAFGGIAIVVGLLGGIYPALILSGFRPIAILKPDTKSRTGSGALRMTLVVLQFAVSIGLGVSALVVFAQITHARQLDLGFDRDNMVVVANADTMTPIARKSFEQTLASDPSIAGVTESGPIPFEYDIEIWNVQVPGILQTYFIRTIDIGFDFPTVYHMHLLAGRALSPNRGQDTNTDTKDTGMDDGRNILVDATAARKFGYSVGDAVGKSILIDNKHATIVGVLDDPKMNGAQTVSAPLIFFNNSNHIDYFSVRARPGHLHDAVAVVDSTWHRFAPDTAIRRHFLSALFDRLFAADERAGTMFGIFVCIAVFIACLGLFGLAAFTAERRTREIGIRKVFGARTRDIVGLLLWQFSIPVLLANAIAWPVAWYYLHRWLEGYAYRISLNPLYFAGVGLAALVIAWLTVVGHAVRVARSNPVHALRYE